MATTHAEDAAEHEEAVAALTSKLEAAKEAICGAGVGPKAGRPKGFAGREALEERWDEMSAAARRQALLRYSNNITVVLMSAGSIDWLPTGCT
eukprot:6213075-Pleurochrysis_carterae.AAC.3